jgi:hypothetical protein
LRALPAKVSCSTDYALPLLADLLLCSNLNLMGIIASCQGLQTAKAGAQAGSFDATCDSSFGILVNSNCLC